MNHFSKIFATPEEMLYFREIFRQFDIDGDGIITKGDMIKTTKKLVEFDQSARIPNSIMS